jgi:hypothetical protein
MKPREVSVWITNARFAPYLSETDGDHEEALTLYVWNARISAAMFETLHHVEVLLRNAVDAQFVPLETDADPRTTWLWNPSLLSEPARARVATTISRIRREGRIPTRGRVVAGLSFGFWRALFDRKYDQLWVSHLHHAFPDGDGSRAEVAKLMATLVPFRNRLAHHETIMRRPIGQHYEELLTLAALISSNASRWIESVSRVPAVLSERPRPAHDRQP